jgi:nicotinate-nucleotide adenylyltransferase
LLNIFNNKKKIGILGGTFDPPHLGHLHISKIALNKLKLDSVIWIITKQNPLKEKPYFSLKARIKMSKSMIQKEKNIFAEYLDDVIKSTNTFKLLRFLKKKNHSKTIFFNGG